MADKETGRVCELPAIVPTTKEIEEILTNYKVIAMVGLSAKKERDSNMVAKYLMASGYRVIPVNPNYDDILGLRSYPSLTEVPDRVDVVDIFRRLDAIPGIVEEAIEKGAGVVWMQENIVHNDAAKRAKEAGLKVVMNKCIMKEHRKMILTKGEGEDG